MTKEIQLTKGKFTIVDDEDFEWLNQRKWHDVNGYAVHTEGRRPNYKKIRMHREIMKPPDGMEVDHINGNGLDNQRINLRVCFHRENMRNHKLNSNNTSGFIGVSYHRRDDNWLAYIRINGKRKHLGYYDTPEKAAHAYDIAAHNSFGEFAHLNFPE